MKAYQLGYFFILYFMLSTILIGQTDKGKISFIYDDKSYVIPFDNVEIRKGEDNNIIMSMKGELIDSLATKTISLEFIMKNLRKPFQVEMDFKRMDKNNNPLEDFSIYYGKEAIIKFSKLNKGDRTVYDPAEISMRIGYFKTEYVDYKITITADFFFTLTSKQNVNKTAKLKDGKIEIII